MDAGALRKEIEDLQATSSSPNGEGLEEHHQKLLELFIRIDKELDENWSNAQGPGAEAKIDSLIQAQSVIMQTAACLQAQTLRDLYYKMALWRRDTTGLDRPLSEMPRTTALAYSVYKDLAALARKESNAASPDEQAS